MIYRLHSTQWPAGLGSGVSLSALDRRSPLQWCFGPQRHVPPCSVTLAGVLLPVVFEYPYLGVILTPSLSWTPHVRHLVSRGNRLFAHCVAWCKSERLPLRFASTLFTSYVLPSISWGSEFLISSPPALRLLNSALRRWERFLLGWPLGSPIASVFLELGWPDAEHLASSRLLSLFGRVHAMPSGDRCPLPTLIFNLASAVPGSWPSQCADICFGVCPGSSLPWQCPLVVSCMRLSSPGPVSPSEVVHSSVDPHRFSRGSSFVVCQPRSRPRCPWPFHLAFTCSSVGARSMVSRSLPWWSCSSSSWPLTFLRVL